eukprot:1190556-Prorocentrum_minimum.AAC.2
MSSSSQLARRRWWGASSGLKAKAFGTRGGRDAVDMGASCRGGGRCSHEVRQSNSQPVQRSISQQIGPPDVQREGTTDPTGGWLGARLWTIALTTDQNDLAGDRCG